ncbi:ABC transporter permease [Nitrincola schmidtii]|uniref:ABC transporter permease n=1 Tax=Nitrincola schmidtii TaxID=1730894 RepID=UPI0014577FFA|nr:FtsX-like permease family protein [Nitrincola schmidtii]
MPKLRYPTLLSSRLSPRFSPSSLWILHALISHWWRHPVQLGTLIIGLLAATALWSGVQALNQQARMSYDQAAARFDSINQAHLINSQQQPISLPDYVSLRRLGWPVSPLIEGNLEVKHEESLSLSVIGIEPLSLQTSNQIAAPSAGLPENLSLNAFLTPPWEVWVSPKTAEVLERLLDQADTSGFPLNPLGEKPTLKISPAIANNELITDSYLAQYWLDMDQQFSRLLLLDSSFSQPLPEDLASRLRVIIPQSDHDISRLTDSFHLNLTALSLLAFLVGLLMVYSSIHLALNQRLPLRRILMSCGVSQRQLMTWLIVELLLISGAIALPGLMVGYWIASLLLPDLSASLAGLYGAQISSELQLSWQWWQQGVLMAWGGTLIAALMPLIQLFKQENPQLSSNSVSLSHHSLFKRLSWIGIVSAMIALLVGQTGESLLSGFLILALVFLSAALLLPYLLDKLLALGQLAARSVTLQWLWSDARLQVPHLAVALVALLLALSTSIGVGGMVEGFRNTFVGWLDQRLAAEVYLRADSPAQALEITDWLSTHEHVSAILPSARADTLLGTTPVDLRGIEVHSTYVDHWPLLSSTEQAWQQIERDSAVMINEQLARQLQLNLGDRLNLEHASSEFTDTEELSAEHFTVAAIYSDYGNPTGQIMMSLDTLYRFWPEAALGSFAIRVDPSQITPLVSQLREEFDLSETQVLDQQAVRNYSVQLFERTFAATQALNLLVLGVASIALFSSLLTLSSMRLTQVAPVWACGVSRRQLMGIELLRLLLMAFMTALIAIPLGLIISYCLVAVINVRAFGWALPWQIFPQQWFTLTLAALVSAFFAALIPVLKLQLSSPSELLKGFRDDQ